MYNQPIRATRTKRLMRQYQHLRDWMMGMDDTTPREDYDIRLKRMLDIELEMQRRGFKWEPDMEAFYKIRKPCGCK